MREVKHGIQDGLKSVLCVGKGLLHLRQSLWQDRALLVSARRCLTLGYQQAGKLGRMFALWCQHRLQLGNWRSQLLRLAFKRLNYRHSKTKSYLHLENSVIKLEVCMCLDLNSKTGGPWQMKKLINGNRTESEKVCDLSGMDAHLEGHGIRNVRRHTQKTSKIFRYFNSHGWWRKGKDDSNGSPTRQLEETTRASPYHVAEHHPARSDSLQPHTEWSSRPDPKTALCRGWCLAWRYTLLVVHARKEEDHAYHECPVFAYPSCFVNVHSVWSWLTF